MVKTPTMGRHAIFRGKQARVQAIITKTGKLWFEQARAKLARIAELKPADISDADTVEFLARGEVNTRLYMRGTDRAPTKG